MEVRNARALGFSGKSYIRSQVPVVHRLPHPGWGGGRPRPAVMEAMRAAEQALR